METKGKCKCPAPGIGKEYRCDDEQMTPFASHCDCDCHSEGKQIMRGLEDVAAGRVKPIEQVRRELKERGST